jgi:hypothetical protein
VDKTTGLRFDQTVVTVGFYPQRHYPDVLRRIGYRDSKTGKKLVFLTNNFTVPALTIAQLYHARWQIELFFKWLKQHLRIKAFYGTSPNAVRTQIWSAIAVYLLVANSQKAAASGFEPLHHSTDFKPDAVRENAHSTSAFSTPHQHPSCPSHKITRVCRTSKPDSCVKKC